MRCIPAASVNELAMEQNEAYTSATSPQDRDLEMQQNGAYTPVNTQNKDILVERNAAYQTVVCPQKDEGDYEVIT